MFETLNARGKPLGHIDLIRNWLFSYFSETDDAARLDTVRANFENAGVILGTKGKKVQEYFRCSLQCRYGFLQDERLYRGFREYFQTAVSEGEPSDYAYDLVSGLGRRDSIELFRTIISGKASPALEGRLPKITGKRDLTVLLGELQRYKVSHPICFALLHRFITETDRAKKRAIGGAVARSIKNLSSFIMRGVFVTSTFRPSRIEEALAKCAKTVFNGTDIESLDIMDDLEQSDAFDVVSDLRFIRRMTEIEMRSNKKALRYLFGINAHQQRGADVLREAQCSVEHVLPQSETYWPGWAGFKDVDPGGWVYRTGNLVVISRRENRGGAEFNANFAAKKRGFSESPLKMARDVAKNHEDWAPGAVAKRSRQLAKVAASIWTFRRAQ